MIERERLTSEQIPEPDCRPGMFQSRAQLLACVALWTASTALVLAIITAVVTVLWILGSMAAHAGEPVYRPDWATCPGGWHASGQFCVQNGQGSANALLRGTGPCPGGWRASGGYCVPNGRASPRAVKNKGGTCPAGWRASGSGFCVR